MANSGIKATPSLIHFEMCQSEVVAMSDLDNRQVE